MIPRNPSLFRFYIDTDLYFENEAEQWVEAPTVEEAARMADLLYAKQWNGFSRVEWTNPVTGEEHCQDLTLSGAVKKSWERAGK